MAIVLKVARTPEEIDDALWLRHEVLVVEDRKFGGVPLPGERMMDRFDALPDVYNVIAYDGDDPIATIRLIKENEIGLPADEYFDFSPYRDRIRNEIRRSQGNGHDCPEPPGAKAVFGSAGMLAVRRPWRNRRDVIRAMYRIAAGVCRSTDVTHIVAVVNHQTASMYRRLGFSPLSENLWSAEIGNHVVPLAARAEDFFAWAFGDLPETPLGAFKDGFERLFVRKGETVFSEGDQGHQAYIVSSGQVRISMRGVDGADLTLAAVHRGELFGEFALIDDKPRSASAVALRDSELITLDRETFHREVVAHPERILQLLGLFTARLRRMDELLSTLVPSRMSKRLELALGLARIRVIRDSKTPQEELTEKASPRAAVGTEFEAHFSRLADELGETGEFIYSNEPVRFMR